MVKVQQIEMIHSLKSLSISSVITWIKHHPVGIVKFWYEILRGLKVVISTLLNLIGIKFLSSKGIDPRFLVTSILFQLFFLLPGSLRHFLLFFLLFLNLNDPCFESIFQIFYHFEKCRRHFTHINLKSYADLFLHKLGPHVLLHVNFK